MPVLVLIYKLMNVPFFTDADGLPDGWEYKYWKDWEGWIAADGCDFNTPDAGADGDVLYNDPGRRNGIKGDGLTNFEEYQLQQHFPDLNPNFTDMCVELDWMYSDDGEPKHNYEPSEETKNKVGEVLLKVGVKVHWSPFSNGNVLSANVAKASTISYSTLTSYLTQNNGTYTYTNNDNDLDIVYAIFAPGWTKVTDLPNSENPATSFGGMYIQNPPGIFVFDLHTSNLGEGKVYYHTNGETSLNIYEAYILGHELGHMLGLDDKNQ